MKVRRKQLYNKHLIRRLTSQYGWVFLLVELYFGSPKGSPKYCQLECGVHFGLHKEMDTHSKVVKPSEIPTFRDKNTGGSTSSHDFGS